MRNLRLLITVIAAILCAWFYTNDMAMAFVLTVVAGVVVLKAAEKLSKEAYYDERDKFIALMASYTTFLVATISIALLVIVELASSILGISILYEWSKEVVTRFAPYTAFMFVVYAVSWVILRTKYS